MQEAIYLILGFVLGLGTAIFLENYGTPRLTRHGERHRI